MSISLTDIYQAKQRIEPYITKTPLIRLQKLDEFLHCQVYVKAEDGKQTVAKYLQQVSKEVGAPVSVKKFVRFETGEGLEKKNEDFAAEVAAQIAGN